MKEIIIITILGVFAFFIYLAVKGLKIEDKNDNNIPDVLEDKAKAIKEEVAAKVKEVTGKKRQVKK